MEAKIEKFINKLNGKTISLTHEGYLQFTDVISDFQINIWKILNEDMIISFRKGESENDTHFIEMKNIEKITLSKNTITFRFKNEQLLILEVLD